MTNENISKRIKMRRTELGLSQYQLASKLGWAGNSTISLYETGQAKVTAQKLGELAAALECSEDYLLGRVEQPTEQLGNQGDPPLSSTALRVAANFEMLSPKDKAEIQWLINYKLKHEKY